MLRIQKLDHLAKQLGVNQRKLIDIADSPEEFCQELNLIDPARPDKVRRVLDVQGALRRLQDRLYCQILLPRLIPSPHNYGGVRGRHIKANALAHSDSRFVLAADVADFFPSISQKRVYRLFVERFKCSPDVARICTKLCTFKNHLALGLVTSPLLADQAMFAIDRRIAAACHRAGLVYTRFVDDLTISGPFDLKESGFADVVRDILFEHGFRLNTTKNQFGRLADGEPVTKLRVRHGKVDVRAEYIQELERQMSDAAQLAKDGEFHGPYYGESQIRGRVLFVAWINPGRRRSLLARLKSIPWEQVREVAEKRGLIQATKRLEPLAVT